VAGNLLDLSEKPSFLRLADVPLRRSVLSDINSVSAPFSLIVHFSPFGTGWPHHKLVDTGAVLLAPFR
jgi:hypothetical protein